MIPHWITDLTGVLAPIVAGVYVIVNLLMKNAVAETNTMMREHIAGDKEKHAAIDQHLEYTDGRINRLESRQQHN